MVALGRPTALAVLAALLFAPAASAGITIDALVSPGAPIRPGLEAAPVELVVSLDCAGLLLGTGSSPQPTVRGVAVTWDAPDTVLFVGAEELRVSVEPCLAGAARVAANSTYRISIHQSAPAFVPQEGSLSVRSVDHNEADSEPATAEAPFSATSTYFSVIAVEPQGPRVIETRANTEAVVVAVDHAGNSGSMISFAPVLIEVDGAPVGSNPLAFSPISVAPSALVMGERVAERTEIDVPVTLPSGSWGRMHVSYRATSVASADPEVSGDEVAFSLFFRNKSVVDQASSPSFLAGFAVLLAVGAGGFVVWQRFLKPRG